MSLCFYGLLLGNFSIGHAAREPIIKYFLFSALSAGFFFGGGKEYFLVCETFKYNEINNALIFSLIDNTETIITLLSLKYGLILIIFSIFFKLSAAPSYFWAPDVYEGTSLAIIAFLIIPIKFSISLALLKILKYIFIIPISVNTLNYIFLVDFDGLLMLFTILSITIGGINAITEQHIKRFLAYSSINQIGFSLLLFLGYSNSIFSLQIYLYFIFTYCLNISSFILILGIFIYKLNFLLNISTIQLNNFNLNYLSDLKTLF
jgi:NADH-quinone oxidoreductase subunit N